MKVMTSPSASVISLSTALSRSSNSPRYFAPATIDAEVERDERACSCRPSGTSPSTMRRARPSTIAVLPTPGSPMSTGLFLVRRDSTWMTRRISSSRPMTGSSLPLRASSVRSRPYFSSAWYCSSGFWLVTRWLPRTSRSASSRRRGDAEPRAGRRRRRRSVSASSRCSVDRYSSPSSRALARRRPRARAYASRRQLRRCAVRRRPGAAWPAPRRPRSRTVSGGDADALEDRAARRPRPGRAARRAGGRA